MADPNDMKQRFTALASEAQAGHLLIEQGVAERCAKYCDDYVGQLQSLAARTDFLLNVKSFGDLASAQALASKFEKLGSDSEGYGSYKEAIGKHVDIVKQMADMFRKAGAAYQASDEATKHAIRATMKQNNV
jgi:hypothetical protein